MKLPYSLILVCAFGASLAFAAAPANSGQTMVVIPFDNLSKVPGIEWIGESFSQTLQEYLTSNTLYTLPREDRVRAYDRRGIPSDLHPSKATIYRMAEEMDVDYMVFGSYSFDGRTFLAKAQLLDVRGEHLLAQVSESGPLTNLRGVQAALGWDLMRAIRPDISTLRQEFVSSVPAIRLDAFEDFVRGVMASDPQGQVRYFREAIRLEPAYSDALLQLGMTYYRERQYDQAIAILVRVPRTSPLSRESSFYLGLAACAQGELERADDAFQFVGSRMPLSEVYNNLGVVASRRGKKDAVRYFQRAVDADPNDEDYRFNLGAEFYRTGDMAGASRELLQAVSLRPADLEARSLLETIGSRSGGAPATATTKVPPERLRRNYDESSFRQLALKVEAANEQQLARLDPPARARFHAERGRNLLLQGFTAEAEAEFRQAVQSDPMNPDAHGGLSRVLEMADDVSAARAEAETAIRLKPAVEPLLVLARLDLRENKTDAAAQRIERALQLDPANERARDLKHAIADKLAEKSPPLHN